MHMTLIANYFIIYEICSSKLISSEKIEENFSNVCSHISEKTKHDERSFSSFL